MKLKPPPRQKLRVHELAAELGWTSRQLLAELANRGEFVKSAALRQLMKCCVEEMTPDGRHYYTVTIGGKVNPDAAWYYPSPSRRAQRIKDHVAFWRGVRVERDEAASVADRVRAWLRGKP